MIMMILKLEKIDKNLPLPKTEDPFTKIEDPFTKTGEDEVFAVASQGLFIV